MTDERRRRAKAGEPRAWICDHVEYDKDECLIWPFGRLLNGYGQAENGVASRIMCEEAHGPAPSSDHHAAHSCGNGQLGCMNPRHLSWKTRAENEADKRIHGTSPQGERHPRSRLTVEQVRYIRDRTDLSTGKLSRELGVTKTHVVSIRHRKRWAHL